MILEVAILDVKVEKVAEFEAMFKEADMDGEIELIADSYFVVVR